MAATPIFLSRSARHSPNGFASVTGQPVRDGRLRLTYSLKFRSFVLCVTSTFLPAIGFDRLFNLLESNQNQSNGGYPPYNVELVAENHYRITIAVAGFAQNELDITAHDNMLIVRGAHPEEQTERKYLYQGIAERNFERKFQLADHIVVRDARLENGLLYIDLERIVPEEMKPRRIEILS